MEHACFTLNTNLYGEGQHNNERNLMKNMQVLYFKKWMGIVCFLLAMSFTAFATMPETLTVDGFPSPNTFLNGVYTHNGSLNNNYVWTKTVGATVYYFYYTNDNYWNIGPDLGSTTTFLYCTAASGQNTSPVGYNDGWLGAPPSYPSVSGITVKGPDPEISVFGNGTPIADGATYTSFSDYTKFGSLTVASSPVSRTYTIQNDGLGDLSITGVTITGANASDFTITTLPTFSPIVSSGQTQLVVRFTPSALGSRTATVNIVNSDADEGNFNFDLKAYVFAPENLVAYGVTNPTAANGIYIHQGVLNSENEYWRHSSGSYYIYKIGECWYIDDNTNTSAYFFKDYCTYENSPKTVSSWLTSTGTGSPKVVSYVVSPEIVVVGNSTSITNNDVTPNLTDHTHFGTAEVGTGSIIRTFTIQNAGGNDLQLTGSSPYITLSGTNASDFTVTTLPTTPITAGSLTTFQITFVPSGEGAKTATVSIANNDGNENPFTFAIKGGGVYAKGLTVSGVTDYTNVNGDYTYQGITNGFATWVHTSGIYRIFNFLLPLTENRYWNIDTDLNPDNGVCFSSNSFNTDPSPVGITPFNWSMGGTISGHMFLGIPVVVYYASEINILGNGNSITDGNVTPITTNYTDFGSILASSGNISQTFTIQNSGKGPLYLTGSPKVVLSGTNASDYTVTAQPTSPVAATSGSTTFTVRFDPSAVGLRTATLSIANDDSDENPYNFSIQGTGLNTIPTAANFSASPGPYQNIAYAFATANFGYSDADSDPLNHVRIAVVPASGTLFVDADGDGVVDGGEALLNGSTVSKANLDAGKLKYLTTGTTSGSFTFDMNDGTAYSSPAKTATLTVIAQPTVTLSLGSSTVGETGGSTTVTATLSHTFGATVTTNLSFSGTATLTSDYTRTGTSIAISSGTTGSVTLSSVADLIDESNETVVVDISSVTNGAESGTQQVTLTITDDDILPTVMNMGTLSITDVSATIPVLVADAGSSNVLVRGVVYSYTETNPTIGEDGVTNQPYGSGGTGPFDETIWPLFASTTYYFRSYATSDAGTSYGGVESFNTYATATSFTGSGNWSTPGNWSSGLPGPTTNVTITGICTVDISPIVNYLTVNPGASLTVASDQMLFLSGDLYLESDATNTASLIINGTLSVTGTTTYLRYITGSQWHMVSSPVYGQSINMFLGLNGLIPTQPTTSIRAMKTYIEPTDLWSALFTNTTLGDMGSGKSHAIWPSTNGTVSFRGILQIGTTNVAITRTPTTGFGWNLIGNPYTSAIAINNAAGVSNFIGLNSAVLDQSYCGIYYWNGSAYVAVNLSDAAFYAQTGQGFFVKSIAGGGTVSFTPAMQTHQPSVQFKNALIPWPEIKLTASLENLSNSTVIRFNAGMKRGLDPGYDAGAFKSGLDIYTKLVDNNGVDFSTQCLPLEADSEMVVPIGLESNAQGGVALSVDINNLPSGVKLSLEDRETGMYTPIAQSGPLVTLPMAVNTKIADRFFLHISYLKTATKTTSIPDGWRIYVAKGQICISGPVIEPAIATVYDLLGRKTGSYQLQKGSMNYIPCFGYRNGIYLISVEQKNGTFSGKIPVLN